MAAKSVADIVELASAYYGSAVLFAALELDLFAEVAAAGPKGLVLTASARGKRLLLNACVAEGLMEKRGEAYFNTPASAAALVPGAQADLTKAIRYNRDVYPAWGKLAEFAKTGKCVERPELHLGEDVERTRVFANSMFGRAMGIGRGVVPLFADEIRALGGKPRLLDLAGGPGAYAILMAQAVDGLAVVTVDLPAIAAVAKENIAKFGLADKIECRVGDYHRDEFERGGYDAVTIFGALHQESPTDIVGILKRARMALRPGGKIFVLDLMTDETHTKPEFSALFALNMALTTENGWVFSDAELKSWLREAGFVAPLTRIVPPPMPHWLVSASVAHPD